MKKRKVSVLAVAGICLLACSVCLLAVWQVHMRLGFRQSQKATEQIGLLLPERTPGIAEAHADDQMPVVEIAGIDYVGLLDVPALGFSTAIADHWNSKVLPSAVGRLWGSVYEGSLVVGGPDAPGQFDFFDAVELGMEIAMTDMTGTQFSYAVSRIDRAKSADAQWLADGDFALTLFCRDTYAMEYIAIRCNP